MIGVAVLAEEGDIVREFFETFSKRPWEFLFAAAFVMMVVICTMDSFDCETARLILALGWTRHSFRRGQQGRNVRSRPTPALSSRMKGDEYRSTGQLATFPGSSNYGLNGGINGRAGRSLRSKHEEVTILRVGYNLFA